MLAWKVWSADQYASTSVSSSGNDGCAGTPSVVPALGYDTAFGYDIGGAPRGSIVARTGSVEPTRGRHTGAGVPRYHPACRSQLAGRSLSAVTGRSRPVLLRPYRSPFFRRLPGDGRINAVLQ